MKLNNSINLKVNLAMGLVIIAGIIILIALFYYNERSIILADENEMLKTIAESIEDQKKKDFDKASLALVPLVENSEIQRLFAKRDREGLIRLLMPVFNRLKKEGVEQFHFAVPPATSFIRFHLIDKFGDDMSHQRTAILDANREKKEVRGLEEGKGGVGLRMIKPMYYEGRHTGTAEIGISVGEYFLKNIKALRNGSYFLYLIDTADEKKESGIKVGMASSIEQEKDVFPVDNDSLTELLKGNRVIKTINGGNNSLLLIPLRNYQEKVAAFFKCVYDRKEVVKKLNYAIMFPMIVGIIMLLITVFMLFAINRRIFFKPINTLKEAFRVISEGDLRMSLQVKSMDEVGALATNFNVFIGKLKQTIEEIVNCSTEIATSADEMSAATYSFSQNAQSQAASAEEITATVEEMSAGMENVSKVTNDQYASMKSLVSLMGELSKTIKEIGTTIKNALLVTENISHEAKTGESSLKIMNSTMVSIIASSRDMTGIVKIISDISDKINLLSLNAAIEAARAGEAGRGFAVVADEISKLADQTATSIKNIESLITGNSSEIEKGMQSITSSIETISKIIESLSSINEMMNLISTYMQNQENLNVSVNEEADKVRIMSESISRAADEQKNAAQEIVRAISSINEFTQSNAMGSEEMAANSKKLSSLAESQEKTVSFFKI